jgi:hypothetical protein
MVNGKSQMVNLKNEHEPGAGLPLRSSALFRHLWTNQKLIDKEGEKEYEGTSLRCFGSRRLHPKVKVVFSQFAKRKSREFVRRFLFAPRALTANSILTATIGETK